MSLEVKFGSLGVELMSQIRPISDLQRLKDILRHIIAANSIEELQQILEFSHPLYQTKAIGILIDF